MFSVEAPSNQIRDGNWGKGLNIFIGDGNIRVQTGVEKDVDLEDPTLSLWDLDSSDKIKSLARALNVECLATRKVTWDARIVGHRGSLYSELENTLEGFRKSAETGCHGVELDVFLLKCGTLVVFHGGGTDENPGDLLDYCGIRGSILEYTADEARRLRFNPNHLEFACPKERLDDATIPTLEEVLEYVKTTDMIVKIELKGPGTAEPVLKLVEDMDMVEQCHYSSFDHDRIARIRELRPDVNPDGSARYKTGALFADGLPENFVQIARAVGASEVHLKYDTCTRERIDEIHMAGMDSMAWFRGPVGMEEDVLWKYHDVGNEDESMYRTVLNSGVRQMCVNKPDVLAGVLKRTVHGDVSNID